MSRPQPDKGRICAVVVTYHPDAQFDACLAGVREQCNETVLVDNGSSRAALDRLQAACAGPVGLIEMGRNAGLGAALNRGIGAAREKGYAWVLLFDQDSLPIADMAGEFAGILAELPEPDRVAILGSAFVDRNRQDAAERPRPAPGAPRWRERRRVITSGMLLAIDAFDGIGPFREDFFIDTVDHEFCRRAQRAGWRILQTTLPLLSHSVGRYRRHRLLGFTVWRSHHPAMRCYFMTRNPMLLARQDRAWTKLARGGLKALANAFLILLLEEDKARKIAATLHGYADGLCGRTAMPAWIRRLTGRPSAGAPVG